MSRIGILPVKIPSGVTVQLDDSAIVIRGTKGEQSVSLPDSLKVTQTDDTVVVERRNEERETRGQHGLIRTLIQNAVTGVSEGFSKQLEVNGVGFKVQVSGNKIVLNLGYSHPHEITLPEGVSAAVEGKIITVSGADKQLIGQVAANVRALRKPEPYKGKGVKYVNERIIRKAGKAAGAK